MNRAPNPKSGERNPPSGNRWRLQDAKARLSELVRDARTNGPQTVTLHGRDAVVVVERRGIRFDATTRHRARHR